MSSGEGITQGEVLPLRARLRTGRDERGMPSKGSNFPARTLIPSLVKTASAPGAIGIDQKGLEILRALRSLHLLMRAERLYEKNHPRRLDSLDGAYDALRYISEVMEGLEIRAERSGIVAPRMGD